MTLYPHEWIIQKASSYKEAFCISLLGGVITLVIGWIVFLYIESGVPTRDIMLETNWEQVPVGYIGCYSLSPIILVIFIILLIATALYYGLPPGYHGRPK